MSKERKQFFERIGCGFVSIGGAALLAAAGLYAGSYPLEFMIGCSSLGTSAVLYGTSRLLKHASVSTESDQALLKAALEIEERNAMWQANKAVYDSVMAVRDAGQCDYLPDGMTNNVWLCVKKTERARRYHEDMSAWRERMNRTETYYRHDSTPKSGVTPVLPSSRFMPEDRSASR